MKLQAGEMYRTRNGEIVGPLLKKAWDSDYPVWDAKRTNVASWNDNGICLVSESHNDLDIIEHIPKDKSMSEKTIKVNFVRSVLYGKNICEFEVTISEAIRLGDEAKRIMDEDSIKVGDFFWYRKSARKCNKGFLDYVSDNDDATYSRNVITKITNPAHIQALTEIYEANK